MPSAVRSERARVAALTRHRDPNDPDVALAGRDLRAAKLEQHIRAVVDQAPPLTADQAGRLTALLAPYAAGGANGAA